jgi:hypothetical protein
MSVVFDVLRVVHLFTAILMAWPFYALVAVNQRVRLGAPLGDRTDLYMENIIKNRTVPCLIFQFTAGITGIALMLLRGVGLGALVTNPAIAIKAALLAFVIGLLSYVHTVLQPKIDVLFAQAGDGPMPPEIAESIGPLRKLRTRFATTCLFCVLVIALLAVQVWVMFPLWLNGVLFLAIVVFVWRTFNSYMQYGWW